MPFSSFVESITRLFFALRTATDEALRELGISTAQFAALDAIGREPGRTNADLARACFVTPQTMHVLVTGQESLGLVVRMPHPTQARLLQLYLSNAGELTVGEGRLLVAEVEQRMLALLSGDEQEQLLRLMRLGAASLG